MKSKYLIKVFVSVAVALIYELILNFQPIMMFLNPDVETNLAYSADQLEFVNWNTSDEGSLISAGDPQILLDPPSTKIITVEADFLCEPADHECTLFYMKEDGTLEYLVEASSAGHVDFTVGSAVTDSLRLDIGDYEGVRLRNINITLNRAEVHISISRIIAVVLIVVCSSLLFRIQRMPDYGIEAKLEEKKEEK